MSLTQRIAAVWIGLQVLFFAGWAWREEARRAPGTGYSILVRVEPVDPRDLISGQYFRLGYAFSRPHRLEESATDPETGAEVWVLLRPEGAFHVPVRWLASRPGHLEPGEVVLVGRKEQWRVLFGVEEYFVPEGTPDPDAKRLGVRLRIGDDGKARIEQVLLDGKPWP